MDPLSITTGVLSLVGSGIKAIQLYQSLATKYSLADLTIISIRTECSSIRLALSQIQNIIENDTSMRNLAAPEQLADEMWEEYTAVVDACSLTFNILSERLGKLELDKVDEYNSATIKAKIKSVMNSEEVACLVQNIRGQGQALGLLLQVFQTATASRTQLLRQERTSVILQNVSNNTKSLIGSVRISRDLDARFSLQSSVIGDEEFGFDDEIVNSRAYRRLIMRHRDRKIPANGNEMQEDEHPDEGAVEKLNANDSNNVESVEPGIVMKLEGFFAPLPEPNFSRESEDAVKWDKLKRQGVCQPSESNFSADEVKETTRDVDLQYLDTNTDNPASSSTEMDVEKESVLTTLRRRVEDWKNYDVSAFGELLIWGEYPIYLSTDGSVKKYVVYLFERILICCKEKRILSGKKPKKLRGLFTKKVPPEPEIASDPENGSLQLRGRVFVQNIVNYMAVNTTDPCIIQISWACNTGVGSFDIRYSTEQELLKWDQQFQIALVDRLRYL